MYWGFYYNKGAMKMTDRNNLTEGNIVRSLLRLAIPIMGTSFLQTAYNLTNMFWLGRAGSAAVAAAGTAGFFTWLAQAFIFIPKIGAEVGVAQAVGRKDIKDARSCVQNSIQLNIVLAIIYAAFLIMFREPLIGFYNLGDMKIISDAKLYLTIISLGLPFLFINPLFSGIFNGHGDSKTPFKYNVAGLTLNVILDPLLIYGLGPIPEMGVAGAAIATVISQFLVTAIFISLALKDKLLFSGWNLFHKPNLKKIRKISKLGIPVAFQSALFTIISMIIARIISDWGSVAIASQKVGSQIEALSWMTAGGFSTALSSFVGQNYGANKWERIRRGYFVGIASAGLVGVFVTLLFLIFPAQIFSAFINESQALTYGISYLKILGISQVFMCIEIATGGAFNGLGKTIPPSIVGIVFNLMRIPMALALSSIPTLGLDGIWWSISISSIFKGIFISAWFIILLNKNKKHLNN
jgi:putative MATE family efflux protein